MKSELRNIGMNQLVVGVSETAPPAQEEPGNAYQPDAPMFRVNRVKQDAARQPEAQSEPDETPFVLVRNTVTLCTETLSVKGPEGPISMANLTEGTAAAAIASNFCKGL